VDGHRAARADRVIGCTNNYSLHGALDPQETYSFPLQPRLPRRPDGEFAGAVMVTHTLAGAGDVSTPRSLDFYSRDALRGLQRRDMLFFRRAEGDEG
jgi:hypothetical protein